MFKKSPLKSTQILKRKRRILYLKIGGVVGSIILIIVLATTLSRLPLFAITSVSVEGNSAVDATDLQAIAQKDISGQYYVLFSKANRFIYPKTQITKDILSFSLRIDMIKMNVKGHDLHISIKERDPAYTWCSGMPDGADTNKCYFIDSNGYIFSESPTFSGNAYFAFYGEVNNDNPLGSTYLNATQFKNIDTLIAYLDSKSLHPYAFRSHDSGIYDLYLEHGGRITFKQGQDIPTLISNLDLIINDTQLFSKKATSTLEYIDLRFGNKLFYKLKGDNELQVGQ